LPAELSLKIAGRVNEFFKSEVIKIEIYEFMNQASARTLGWGMLLHGDIYYVLFQGTLQGQACLQLYG